MISPLLSLLYSSVLVGFHWVWLANLLSPTASRMYVAGHVLLCVLCTIGMIPFFHRRFKIPSYRLSFALIFVPLLLLPFVGSLFFFLSTSLLVFIPQDSSIPFSTEDEDKEFFKLFEFGTPEESEQERLEMVLEELEIEPYVDTLKHGDAELKKGAIQKLTEMVSPLSIKLLKMALSDEHPEIRLMASKSLSSLEEDINDDILTASIKVKNESQNSDAHNELGNIYFRYASLGLLDASTQKFYFEKAIHEFLTSLQLTPKQQDILILVGKTLLSVANHHKAEEIFRRVLSLDPNNLEARFGLCNSLLGKRDFEGIGEECEELKKLMSEKNHEELLTYWGKEREILRALPSG